MTHATPSLDRYSRYKGVILDALREVTGAFQTLERPNNAALYAAAGTKLENARFVIAVVGEMKHGKSTLINAMLGEPVLPAWRSVVCTGASIQVTYGSTKRALCYRRGEQQPEELDLVADPNGLIDRLTVRRAEHRPRPDSDEDAMGMHPYSKAEVYWPLELCRHGAEIWDTPGMNEAGKDGEQRESETWARLASDADAVILIFSCNKFGTASETRTLKRVVSRIVDASSLFVAMNRFDEIRGTSDEPKIKSEIADTLGSHGVRDDRIFYTVASEALEGRRTQSQELVDASGLATLELHLIHFLTSQKMLSKLTGALKAAELGVVEATSEIILSETRRPGAITRESGAAVVAARACVAKSASASKRLSSRVARIGADVAQDTRSALQRLAQALTSGVQAKTEEVSITNLDAVFKRTESIERLVNHLKEWTEGAAAEWEREYIDNVVRRHSASLREDVDSSVEELGAALAEISAMHESLRRDQGTSSGSLAGRSDRASAVAEWNRAQDSIAAIVRSVGTDFASSAIAPGAITGAVLGTWLSLTFLFPLLPVVAVAVAVGAALGMSGAADRLKDRVASAVRDGIRQKLPALEDSVAGAASVRFTEAGRTVLGKLQDIERAVKGVAQSIEDIHAKREQTAATLQAKYAEHRDLLHKHALALDELRRLLEPSQIPESVLFQVTEHVRRRLLEELESKTPVDASVGASAHASSPVASAIEVKGGLSDGLSEQLRKCVEVLTPRGWTPAKTKELTEWAEVWEAKAGRESPKQRWAFLAVMAKAIDLGGELPPKRHEVTKLWTGNPEFQADAARLHGILAEDPTGRELADSPNSPDTGKKRLIENYERARKLVFGRGRGEAEADDDGSVNTARSVIRDDQREPFRRPE